MENSIQDLIWQARKISFALTDRNLVIHQLNGQVGIIGGETMNYLGCSLLDIFPELIGSEQDLADILSGKLDFISRESRRGETRYLVMEDLPYRDNTGSFAGVIHLVQDVTIQGELEQQLTQNRNDLQLLQERVARQNLDLVAANTELSRLSELKSRFISVAAHELRTPLTSVDGYVEMLLDEQVGPLTAAQREYLEIVQSSGQRLRKLTENLLNAALLEAGRIDLVLRPVDLVALVKAVVSEYSVHLQSKAQRISLEFSRGLPLALCDETRAGQILTNLLSNASKYTPNAGHISILLSLADQPGYLQLSVADTGVGISNRDQSKIFTRGFRTKKAISLSTQGSGLGLYITRALVELHGGSIWFESHPNQGSVFYVTFPVAA